MGIPMIAGRPFQDYDTREAKPVIIITQSMARKLFGDQNPLGKRIRSWRDENVYREIVGIVGDIRYEGLAEEAGSLVYVPQRQDTWNSMIFVVRSASDPLPLISSARSAIWSLDSKLTVSEVKTMDAIIATELARPRFSMLLLGIFALVALALSAVGIYGVMTYSVSQRTREIGIRMALGAARQDVLTMVAGKGLLLAAIGGAIGLTGALALTRLMKNLLFDVSPADPQIFLLVPAVLFAVALAACYLPARRATRIDPMEALRHD